VTDEGVIITAMKARELGPKSVVVGDLVEIVGDVTGSEGSLARIVVVNERTNSLSRTVDDVARVERTIVANIDQLLIVVASANPEPRRGLIDRFLVSAFHESIKPIIIVTKVDVSPVPEFIQEYKALGVDIGWYDQEVFRKTSTISRQIFPIELDIDHRRWIPNLKRMNSAFIAMDAAKRQGGIGGRLAGWAAGAKAAFAFAALYTIPARRHDLPADVRLEPSY
jgi:hypothetical protein